MEQPVEKAQTIETAAAPVCAGCNAPLAEPVPRNPICPDCRQRFIRYPIPHWIKGFGAGVLLLMIFCLYQLPANLKTGIHYKRGLMAAGSRNYRTAQKEFQQAVLREPGFLEAQCRLLVAAYYNHDYITLGNVAVQLEGKNVEDAALYHEVSRVMNLANQYFPSDSFMHFTEQLALPEDSIPINAYTQYLAQHPEDTYASLYLTQRLMSVENYAAADSLLNKRLELQPALRMHQVYKVQVKRDLQQFDSAYFYAEKLLAMNEQDVFALSSKARILLQQKKDSEALEVAKQAHELDGHDGHAAATLVLAYHYNHDTHKRDALLKKAESDTTIAEYIGIAKDIISGKASFRN
jgi:tetratricopeptide (TPR) repeat protein